MALCLQYLPKAPGQFLQKCEWSQAPLPRRRLPKWAVLDPSALQQLSRSCGRHASSLTNPSNMTKVQAALHLSGMRGETDLTLHELASRLCTEHETTHYPSASPLPGAVPVSPASHRLLCPWPSASLARPRIHVSSSNAWGCKIQTHFPRSPWLHPGRAQEHLHDQRCQETRFLCLRQHHCTRLPAIRTSEQTSDRSLWLCTTAQALFDWGCTFLWQSMCCQCHFPHFVPQHSKTRWLRRTTPLAGNKA
mmetsp:Transcript_34485/g.78704  ORF Transcript_34485/g.78704 Transcript_34485/m.78704 type:complete len:249 (-) Transcript_34485:60-806(-)